MATIDGVITVLPAPDGYDVDFANPTRDWKIIHQIYWIYGVGTFLALFFLVQNLYVKLYINRKLDGETSKRREGTSYPTIPTTRASSRVADF